MFPFKTALNTSTLFPYKLNVLEQIDVARKAGYEGIELWMKDIEAYLQNGGTVESLKTALDEAKLSFINAIAFFKWADVDKETREAAFVQAENEMRLLSTLGCSSIAAPPFGDVEAVSLDEMAQHFQRLVALGREIGVEPILEFWGKANQLSTLNQAREVVEKSNVIDAKMLLDPFHMYVGGSDFSGLKHLRGDQIGIFHVNDYPESPAREELEDSDRVFPGEGALPIQEIAGILYECKYDGYLSLELFISDFGEQTALEVARYGLDTMKKSFTINA